MNGAAGQSGPHWRRVMSALANTDARTAYAQIVLGEEVLSGVKEQRRSKAIGILLDSRLVEWSAENGLAASGAVFHELLSQQPKRQPKTGVDRFLRHGRIERYPASAGERRELLAFIARQAVQPGEDLTEQQVNDRLLNYTEDVVLLRRYLIDYGMLERTRSGSSYARPTDDVAEG